MVAAEEYFGKAEELLEKIRRTQLKAILKASEVISESMAKGGVLHLYGTGHSHMIAEEPFYRAGGLAAVNTIWDPCFSNLHLLRNSRLERLEGYGKVIIDATEFSENDALIVISVSGRNAVPIEVAMEAKKRGIPVIAITSMDYSKKAPSRHPSGKHLCDVADVVIDNCVPYGDAVLDVKGVPQKVAAVSTVAGAAIVNAITGQVAENMAEMGVEPPVFLSGNIEGAEEHNKRLVKRYGKKIGLI